MTDPTALTDDELLDRFQSAAFGYFLAQVNPANGLVTDTSYEQAPASIAVMGFALSCYPIGVARGWITRESAARLTLAALRFFANSSQGKAADATGHNGFFYHFLDMQTGQRAWRCELSVMDTALLMAGVLVAAEFFDRSERAEIEIRELSARLYRHVDWNWARGRQTSLCLGWKPESGFLRHRWHGYSEAIILHILALGSPTHPIPAGCYSDWASTFQWKTIYGRNLLYGGPLFMHQFSHAWIDLRGIRDAFMRDRNSDYFENSRRATHVHRDYAIDNPHGFAGYGENLWGLSACDGPGKLRVGRAGNRRNLFGYKARGAPFGPDDGTLAPAAIIGSLPFAPEIVLPALRHLFDQYPNVIPGHELPGGFNPTLANRRSLGNDGWVSKHRFGLDQGVAVMMIENHRSGLIWNLMRKNPVLSAGLLHAGFTAM